MAKLKITEHPAPVLGQAGEPVTEFDEKLAQLAADMFETMYAANGVGLAAQQVGLALRFFVMDCDGLKLEAANPEIIATEGEQTGDEGCLSVGVVPAVLTRPNAVTLRAQNLQGEWFERAAEGYAARCFLHETDHTNGKLFISHLPPLRREMVLKRFQKIKKFRRK
jgi:peptide deformylase